MLSADKLEKLPGTAPRPTPFCHDLMFEAKVPEVSLVSNTEPKEKIFHKSTLNESESYTAWKWKQLNDQNKNNDASIERSSSISVENRSGQQDYCNSPKNNETKFVRFQDSHKKDLLDLRDNKCECCRKASKPPVQAVSSLKNSNDDVYKTQNKLCQMNLNICHKGRFDVTPKLSEVNKYPKTIRPSVNNAVTTEIICERRSKYVSSPKYIAEKNRLNKIDENIVCSRCENSDGEVKRGIDKVFQILEIQNNKLLTLQLQVEKLIDFQPSKLNQLKEPRKIVLQDKSTQFECDKLFYSVGVMTDKLEELNIENKDRSGQSIKEIYCDNKDLRQTRMKLCAEETPRLQSNNSRDSLKELEDEQEQIKQATGVTEFNEYTTQDISMIMKKLAAKYLTPSILLEHDRELALCNAKNVRNMEKTVYNLKNMPISTLRCLENYSNQDLGRMKQQQQVKNVGEWVLQNKNIKNVDTKLINKDSSNFNILDVKALRNLPKLL